MFIIQVVILHFNFHTVTPTALDFQNTEADLSTFRQTEQAPHFCQIIPLGLNSRVA